jgi:hypothetical protein
VEVAVVVLGVVVGALIVVVTILWSRVGRLEDRTAVLEIEVGKGSAHEEQTGGLPVAEDRTLRGRMAAAEGAIERAGARILSAARRRRLRKV